jgi:nucleoside diphosphate kinase
MMSGPITAIVLNGNPDIVRSIVGDTYPYKFEKGSIRGDLASSIVENLIHCSEGENMDLDIDLWLS